MSATLPAKRFRSESRRSNNDYNRHNLTASTISSELAIQNHKLSGKSADAEWED